MEQRDVVILGAGPTGLLLSTALPLDSLSHL
jgi:2-polyprenyl-6-methoxyphenol hydroxylase-like FAD-dependent oxidoreductase